MKEYYLAVTGNFWSPPGITIRAEVERPSPYVTVFFVETELPRLKIKTLGGVLKVSTTLLDWSKFKNWSKPRNA